MLQSSGFEIHIEFNCTFYFFVGYFIFGVSIYYIMLVRVQVHGTIS